MFKTNPTTKDNNKFKSKTVKKEKKKLQQTIKV